MNWLGDIIQNHVSLADTVLDVGCGIMQATDGLQAKSILGCDTWAVYLDHIKNRYQTVQVSMQELDRFMDNSYDIVLALDVLEHLDHELALQSLLHLKRIARKKVIIFTPAEFKTNESAVPNAWELGHNPLQMHLCVITKEEMNKAGYFVRTDNPDNAYFATWTR